MMIKVKYYNSKSSIRGRKSKAVPQWWALPTFSIPSISAACKHCIFLCTNPLQYVVRCWGPGGVDVQRAVFPKAAHRETWGLFAASCLHHCWLQAYVIHAGRTLVKGCVDFCAVVKFCVEVDNPLTVGPNILSAVGLFDVLYCLFQDSLPICCTR